MDIAAHQDDIQDGGWKIPVHFTFLGHICRQHFLYFDLPVPFGALPLFSFHKCRFLMIGDIQVLYSDEIWFSFLLQYIDHAAFEVQPLVDYLGYPK